MPDSVLLDHQEDKEVASMPETLSKSDAALPSKRKPDSLPIHPNKTQKLPASNENGVAANSSNPEDSTENNNAVVEEEDDDDDYVDDDDDEGEEESPVVDRKGKGKMIEEEDDDGDSDDDDDDDDEDDEMDGGDGDDSELDDDPLAEVDLDNILPSRTRRKSTHRPGVFIGKNHGKDDDDSDA
ncbi:uncharacterized protein LOC126679847 [Mercurialis annua]|uniref:uncharacterized protein LOC126679847 n=1 Tax=Mercurialis annua TaxID=3986 RepID=UPI00215F8156|nr:uncharacterized protein LOC126679847 [Mercurialis annua]